MEAPRGGVDWPVLGVVPITPTHILSAGTLSHGTAPSQKSRNVECVPAKRRDWDWQSSSNHFHVRAGLNICSASSNGWEQLSGVECGEGF